MRRPEFHVIDDFASQFTEIAGIKMHISEGIDIRKC